MTKCVLLTIDSLRYDVCTKENLPDSFETFADDFVEYSSAYSHGVATPFAFPGLIAAAHPIGNGNLPEEQPHLPELIPGKSIAFTNNGHLSEKRGYSRGFDEFYAKLPSGEVKSSIIERLKDIKWLRESETVRMLYQYLSTIGNSEELPVPYTPSSDVTDFLLEKLRDSNPDFLWGHYMDPHTPYHPDYATEGVSNLPSSSELVDLDNRIVSASCGAEDLSKEELDFSFKLYQQNIQYMDEHLGRLLKSLRDQPWYDDALIIVTSDHGYLFGENGLLFHQWNYDPHEELVHVPLWVKYPDNMNGGTSVDYNVSHSDIAQTIATIFESTDKIDNSYVEDLRSGSKRHIVSLSNSSKRLIETNGHKILRRDGSTETEGDVSDRGNERLQKIEFPNIMTSTGVVLGAEDDEKYVDSNSGEDEELNEQLRALGYR